VLGCNGEGTLKRVSVRSNLGALAFTGFFALGSTNHPFPQNGGHCKPHLFQAAPDIAKFELRNYRNIAELITQHQIDCEYQQLSRGTCFTFNSTDDFIEAQKLVRALQSSDPELARYITVVEDKASLTDLLIPNAVGAVTQTIAAKLWPYKLIAWILEDLVKNSQLNLQTKTPVLSLKLNDRVSNQWDVCTDRGTIAAKRVVLATNGYTSHLLPEFTSLIIPIRGEMSALKPPTILREKPLTHTYGFIGGDDRGYIHDGYLTQRPIDATGSSGGHMMFGGGRSYAKNKGIGVDDDSEIDELSAERLRTGLLKHLVPSGNGDDAKDAPPLEAENEWSGIMGFSRDRYPWVGEVPGRKGVYLSGGYTGHGLSLYFPRHKAPLNVLSTTDSHPPTLGMPNASLCARYITQLVLAADEHSQGTRTEKQSADQHVAIPEAYMISEERMERVKEQAPHPAIFDPGLL
jgi:glycine/D-amino acid oxidase-like deaminating enzyme